ncbi:tRNA-specific adenosine deaminase [Paracoccidioides lutzii Pb01]|uniref:tRNA-specific adenosine deaminase n=1 Tax=Paracoccidioides lutzii (strain ATCC MYA-826 / Pb01) TaxID=502779 RepID=C1GSK0_PARBA|nr:tRNA-specific adenosine deaminase [Paracoccidioides lutzii Pb01]EEH39033.2 tRNA-specific adenosine deaminase [Paracoccidioides lutzii Pb01]
MLLRRFYIQENERAPNPKPKKDRELKDVFDEDIEAGIDLVKIIPLP